MKFKRIFLTLFLVFCFSTAVNAEGNSKNAVNQEQNVNNKKGVTVKMQFSHNFEADKMTKIFYYEFLYRYFAHLFVENIKEKYGVDLSRFLLKFGYISLKDCILDNGNKDELNLVVDIERFLAESNSNEKDAIIKYMGNIATGSLFDIFIKEYAPKIKNVPENYAEPFLEQFKCKGKEEFCDMITRSIAEKYKVKKEEVVNALNNLKNIDQGKKDLFLKIAENCKITISA